MITLSNLTAYPPPYDHDPFSQSSVSQATSFLSSYLPSAQGQGPIGRAIRIAIKLRQKFSPFRIFSWTDSLAAAARKRDEEIRGKAIKVIDLLQYSAELGNTDALYILARLSLVRSYYFPDFVSCLHLRKHIFTVSPKCLFYVRSQARVLLLFYTCILDWKRILASSSCVLLCYRVRRHGISGSSQSYVVLRLCCTGRTQRCANGARIPLLEWYWYIGRLFSGCGVVRSSC